MSSYLTPKIGWKFGYCVFGPTGSVKVLTDPTTPLLFGKTSLSESVTDPSTPLLFEWICEEDTVPIIPPLFERICEGDTDPITPLLWLLNINLINLIVLLSSD